MKTLLCKIGTQGLADGRCIPRGDTYEVDDNTASTLVAANYAEYVTAPTVADVVESDTTDVLDKEVVDEGALDEEVIEIVSDEDATSVAEDAINKAESVAVPKTPKRTYKRRT